MAAEFFSSLKFGVAPETIACPMGDVRMGLFDPHGETRFICTQDLNGCSAVVIISSIACIIAHIPPLPTYTDDPYIGTNNARFMMERVRATFQANRAYFPECHSWVIVATWGGQLALPEQASILEATIDQQLGIPRRTVTYTALPRGAPRNELKGTVIVVVKPQEKPCVWIEGELQQPDAESADVDHVTDVLGSGLVGGFTLLSSSIA
jgi:hypothetical protein